MHDPECPTTNPVLIAWATRSNPRSPACPENALVLSVDEKSQIQALDRTQPELPMRTGEPRRLTATYKRHGTTCLLAALSVHDGEVTARCRDKNDHTTFLAFLKTLYRASTSTSSATTSRSTSTAR
jgi:endonuclease/exonuclease/phosphatase (EEP) superfamily protein YafD